MHVFSSCWIGFTLFLILACGTPKAIVEESKTSEEPTYSTQYLNQQLDSIIIAGAPSVAIAVIKPDTILYGLSGTTKVGSETQVTLQSKYHLGSNSKAITSFIAFKLIEQGRISLNTKFTDLHADSMITNSPYRDITLGDLLSHRAHVQAFTSGAEFYTIPPLVGDTESRRLQFALEVLKRDPIHSKTLSYDYSNAGYAISASMLEIATKESYEDLLAQTMADLSLDYYNGFPNKEDINHPWGHWMSGYNFVAHPPDHEYKLQDYMLPAGDISMNIQDYSTFVQMHLRGLNGEDNYLTSESYRAMHYANEGYSYGWGNAIMDEKQGSYHDGTTGTFYCHTILIPSTNIAIAITINSAQPEHVKAIYALRKKLTEHYQN